MCSSSKELYGSWLASIGTISSAVGSTPSVFIQHDLLEELNLWGNILQATGSAIQADGQEDGSLGNEVQSIGNLTVITGLVSDIESETKQKLNTSGNWIQAFGGLISLTDELEDPTSISQAYTVIGNLLQIIGNSLQALAGMYALKGNQIAGTILQYLEFLSFSGSWIQAVGSVLSFIGQLKALS